MKKKNTLHILMSEARGSDRIAMTILWLRAETFDEIHSAAKETLIGSYSHIPVSEV